MVERDGAPDAAPTSEAAVSPISFELEQVFGVDVRPAEAILGRIESATVDANGAVYVVDASRRVVAFESDGNVRWIRGRPGEGPGDLSETRGIVSDGAETLYLSNRAGARVDMWNTRGAFLDSIDLSALGVVGVFASGFIPPSKLVLRRNLRGHVGARVIVLSLDGSPRIVSDFEIDGAPGFELPSNVSGTLAIRVSGGHIFAGSRGTYSLKEFDSDGKLVRTIERRVDYLKLPVYYKRGGRVGSASLGSLGPPLVLGGGFLLASALWPDDADDLQSLVDDLPVEMIGPTLAARLNGTRWTSSLDLFAPDGIFLYSRTWPGEKELPIGSIHMTGEDGALYTITDDPFPQVRRYRVVLNASVD